VGFIVRIDVPVFVTVVTDWVKVLLTRLPPKSNELLLTDALVEAVGAAGLTIREVLEL
jgi:hypothetical protein